MHRNRRLALFLGAALALLLGASSLASAAGPEKIVQGRYLQIVSSMSEDADNLSPGDSARWTVGVSADGVEDGMIRRTLVVDGALAPYVLVSVESCASRPLRGRLPGCDHTGEGARPHRRPHDRPGQPEHHLAGLAGGQGDVIPESPRLCAGTRRIAARARPRGR